MSCSVKACDADADAFVVGCRLHGCVRFKVQYDEYGNQETVDAYAVRPRASSQVAKAGGGALKKKKVGEKAAEQEEDVDGEEGPKIPEHLKILAGDSDKVRPALRRLLRALVMFAATGQREQKETHSCNQIAMAHEKERG